MLIKFITSIIIVIGVLFLPDSTFAQEPGGLVASCEGTSCSACNLVDLANNVIKWLIGIMFLLFAVLTVVAGFGLVTSGGNTSALQDAKKKLTNGIIGIIIVMAAWLLVDTMMRGLLGDNGEISGYGPWSEIECGIQVPTTINADLYPPINYPENEASPDAVVGGGTSVAPVAQGQMSSLKGSGVNVANWFGINGPNRTDLAHPTAVQAAVKMQNIGKERFGKQPFQVTAAYTKGVGHSANSKHYQGIAIDFQPINGVSKAQVAQLAREAGFTYVLIEEKHVHADMR